MVPPPQGMDQRRFERQSRRRGDDSQAKKARRDGIKTTSPGDLHWYACRTRARAEKQVDPLPQRAGLESHLPPVELEWKRADRIKRVAFPIFPGLYLCSFPVAEPF